jgi:type IV pilus assembly protein PilF
MDYLRRNRFETASSEFETALAINPNSDTAYHSKALLMARKGDNQRATSNFSRAVALNPENFLAVNDYAIHLCQQDESSKGLKQLVRIEDNPSNNKLLGTQLGLGICLLRAKKPDEAEKYLRTVLLDTPTLPQALLPMAEISVLNNKFLTARAFLERYFATGAFSERSLFLAANVEHQLDDPNKANQYRRALLRAYPASSYNETLDGLLQ